MNQLIIFLDRYLNYAKTWSAPLKAMDQAFGGLQLFCELFPDNMTQKKAIVLWNEVYKPEFEKIIYGD